MHTSLLLNFRGIWHCITHSVIDISVEVLTFFFYLGIYFPSHIYKLFEGKWVLCTLFLAEIKRYAIFQWFSNFKMHQSHLEGLLKHRLLGLTSWISDSVGLRVGLENCISNKFLGVSNSMSLNSILWDHSHNKCLLNDMLNQHIFVLNALLRNISHNCGGFMKVFERYWFICCWPVYEEKRYSNVL